QLFLEHVGQTSDNPMMLEVERAEGIYLYGRDGKRWIDLISGVSAQDYLHLMVYGEAVESPQRSGRRGVETAKRYTGRTEIIYYKNAYHGSTHGSLSVMGGEEYRNAYRPLLPDTRQIRFNEPADLRYVTPRTACVIIEPTGTLLIYDEIQTGLGRTGTLYFFQQYGIVPDILCTAKAFGGGMPLGAFIASNRIMSVLKPTRYWATSPRSADTLCCCAGLAALEYILSERLTEQADAKGALYESLLADIRSSAKSGGRVCCWASNSATAN
ncbi:unnamed protein product, partial [Mycena citricolor]